MLPDQRRIHCGRLYMGNEILVSNEIGTGLFPVWDRIFFHGSRSPHRQRFDAWFYRLRRIEKPARPLHAWHETNLSSLALFPFSSSFFHLATGGEMLYLPKKG